mmetsp:Transcript_26201/g.55529  ORF Transcript_26201/g.55529 Transcript_26201/m.55529 type:complete len:230 (-) Transcript_26201:1472-2161(-)
MRASTLALVRWLARVRALRRRNRGAWPPPPRAGNQVLRVPPSSSRTRRGCQHPRSRSSWPWSTDGSKRSGGTSLTPGAAQLHRATVLAWCPPATEWSRALAATATPTALPGACTLMAPRLATTPAPQAWRRSRWLPQGGMRGSLRPWPLLRTATPMRLRERRGSASPQTVASSRSPVGTCRRTRPMPKATPPQEGRQSLRGTATPPELLRRRRLKHSMSAARWPTLAMR